MKGLFNSSERKNRTQKLATMALPLLFVAACAGNDDGTAQTSGPGGGQAAGSTAAPNTNLNAFQTEILQLVNEARVQGAVCGTNTMPAVPALQWNDAAESAAESHSQYMKDTESFSHDGANGSTPGVRLSSTGYVWSKVGENIAAGYPDVPATITGWLNSEGHCLNMMSADFQQMGVAVIDGDASNTYSNYWTMVLATPL